MATIRCHRCQTEYEFTDARYDHCSVCGQTESISPLWQDFPAGPPTAPRRAHILPSLPPYPPVDTSADQKLWAMYRARKVIQTSAALGLVAMAGLAVLVTVPPLAPLIIILALLGLGSMVGLTVGCLMGMRTLGSLWPPLILIIVLIIFFPGVCMLPLVLLVMWIVVGVETNAAFRRQGLRPGWFGVTAHQLNTALSGRFCRTCDYDLTGNVSGTCPECGTPRPPSKPAGPD